MKKYLFNSLVAVGCMMAGGVRAEVITVDSLVALCDLAHSNNVSVKLKPGVYDLNDPALGQELDMKLYEGDTPTRDYPAAALILFSGNHSFYDLTGTEIRLDTKLHQAFGKRKLFEVFVTGDDNIIEGLTVKDVGDHAPTGSAIMLTVMGDNNTIRKADLFIHGSYPYGYGHLLGKGANPIVTPRKHSSFLIAGENTKVLGCKVVTRAFGHGIVMQGAVDTLIKDCYVEGELRTTDDMLKEKSGPAFDAGFKSDYPPGKIIPGQIKCLSEDGIRTYPYGSLVGRSTERVTVVNCTIKNMRSGVAFGAERGPSRVMNTTAIGCRERGFSIGSNGTIEGCKGDAKYGPLLTFLGRGTKNCVIDLELVNTVSDIEFPRLLEVNGSGHHITLRNYEGKKRSKLTPIVFGESDWGDIHLFRAPDSDPAKYSGAKNCTLINETGMPIILSELTENCTVVTDGKILKNRGKNNTVIRD
jgi:hypothetical protein